MKRLGMVLLGLMFWSMNTLADYHESEYCYIGKANVYGKYSELMQRFDCPADQASYGEYKDDGYWRGDGWHCGRETVYNGYWVWVSPTWFVWESRPRRASNAAYQWEREASDAEYESTDCTNAIKILKTYK